MPTRNQKNKKVIFICQQIYDIYNSTRYQRCVLLVENFDTVLISKISPPEDISRRFSRVIVLPRMFALGIVIIPLYFWITEGYKIIHTAQNIPSIISGFSFKFISRGKWIYDMWDHPSLEFEPSVGIYRKFKKFIWKHIVSKMVRYADCWIIGMQNGIIDFMPIPSNNCSIIKTTNGTDHIKNQLFQHEGSANATNKTKPKNFTLKIVSIGWATRERGLDLIVNILRSLEKENIMIQFTLAGFSDKNSLNAILAHNNSCNNKINYVGRIKSTDVFRLYNQANVGLCLLSKDITNYHYAYPIKIFEYMSFGLVTIATDTYGTREIIDNGVNGFLVENTSDSIICPIKKIIKKPNLLQEISATSLNTSSLYRWKDINNYLASKLKPYHRI